MKAVHFFFKGSWNQFESREDAEGCLAEEEAGEN